MATLSWPLVLNQVVYPYAYDVDDCWVVATIWAAWASDRSVDLPTIPEFRAAAGDPDDGYRDGGTLNEVFGGAVELFPELHPVRYSGSWTGFVALAKESPRPISLAVLSGSLPPEHQYGFKGWHQVAVVYDGGWLLMNPLAPEGSKLKPISEAALRTAVMPLGYVRAVLFDPPKENPVDFEILKGPDGLPIVRTIVVGTDPGIGYLRGDGEFVTATGLLGATKVGIQVRLARPILPGRPSTDDWRLAWLIGDAAAFVLHRNVTVQKDPTPFSGADLTAAIAADRAKARIVYS